MAIAHNILTDTENTLPKYKEFLAGGCSDTPVNLLRKVGIDLETIQPIHDALAVMGTVLDEMEEA